MCAGREYEEDGGEGQNTPDPVGSGDWTNQVALGMGVNTLSGGSIPPWFTRSRWVYHSRFRVRIHLYALESGMKMISILIVVWVAYAQTQTTA